MKTVADRHIHSGFTGADVVFRALPASASLPFSELERDINRSLTRLMRAPQGKASG